MEVHHGDVVEELVGLDAFRESNQAFADFLGPHAFALLEICLDAAGVEHRSILTVRLAETIRVENEVITELELDRVLCPLRLGKRAENGAGGVRHELRGLAGALQDR